MFFPMSHQEPDVSADNYTLARCVEIMWLQHPLSLMEPKNLCKNLQRVFSKNFPEIKLKVDSVLELPSGNSLAHLTSKLAVDHILEKAANSVYSIQVKFRMGEPKLLDESNVTFLSSLDEIWDETSVIIDLDKMPDTLRPQAKDLIMAKHVQFDEKLNKISATGAFEEIQELRWELQGLYSGNVSHLEPVSVPADTKDNSVFERESFNELDISSSSFRQEKGIKVIQKELPVDQKDLRLVLPPGIEGRPEELSKEEELVVEAKKVGIVEEISAVALRPKEPTRQKVVVVEAEKVQRLPAVPLTQKKPSKEEVPQVSPLPPASWVKETAPMVIKGMPSETPVAKAATAVGDKTIKDQGKARPTEDKTEKVFIPSLSSSPTKAKEPQEPAESTAPTDVFLFDPIITSSGFDFTKKIAKRQLLLSSSRGGQGGIPLTMLEYDYINEAYSEEIQSISDRFKVGLTPEIILNVQPTQDNKDPTAVEEAQELLISLVEEAMPNLAESTLSVSFEETPIVQKALPEIQAKHKRLVAKQLKEGYSLVGPVEEIKDAQDELIMALKKAEEKPLLEMEGTCDLLENGFDIYHNYWQILLLKHEVDLTNISIRYDVGINVQDSSNNEMKKVSIKQSTGTYNMLWQAHEAFIDLYQSVATNVASVSLENMKDLEYMKMMEDELTHKYKGLLFLEKPDEFTLVGPYSDLVKAVNDVNNLLNRKIFKDIPNVDK
eukprot:gi/632987748/ref/XP_007882727.1/ PREDICTED: uncharacterized protein LOC103171747 [Callorhinchus milii]